MFEFHEQFRAAELADTLKYTPSVFHNESMFGHTYHIHTDNRIVNEIPPQLANIGLHLRVPRTARFVDSVQPHRTKLAAFLPYLGQPLLTHTFRMPKSLKKLDPLCHIPFFSDELYVSLL